MLAKRDLNITNLQRNKTTTWKNVIQSVFVHVQCNQRKQLRISMKIDWLYCCRWKELPIYRPKHLWLAITDTCVVLLSWRFSYLHLFKGQHHFTYLFKKKKNITLPIELLHSAYFSLLSQNYKNNCIASWIIVFLTLGQNNCLINLMKL